MDRVNFVEKWKKFQAKQKKNKTRAFKRQKKGIYI